MTTTVVATITQTSTVNSTCDTRYFYVDATGGDDDNDGLSPGAAWQTVSKVNGYSFIAGDHVLFKAGEEWQATEADSGAARLLVTHSGSAANPIVYGRYGVGADPRFDHCVSFTDWALYDDPTYRRSDTSSDAGRGVFEGEARLIHTTSIANVKAIAGSYYWESNYLYVHTTTGGNPNSMSVGHPISSAYLGGMHIEDQDYVTVEYLHVTKVYQHCFYVCGETKDSTKVILQNCEASFANGRGFRMITSSDYRVIECQILDCTAHDTAAEGIWANGYQTLIEGNEIYDCKKDYPTKNIGNAIDNSGIIIGLKSDGVILRHNYIHDGYHNSLLSMEYEAGYPRPTGVIFDSNHVLDNQATATVSVNVMGDSTCVVMNNIIEKTAASQDLQVMRIFNGADGPMIYDNTLIQRKTTWVISVHDTASAIIKNNIFRNYGGSPILKVEATASWELANNRYSGGAGGTSFYGQIGATTYSTAQFPDFKTDAGDNSTLGLPGFMDVGGDYHLDVGSACIGAGVKVEEVTNDYDDVGRGDPPDIGAYEYTG